MSSVFPRAAGKRVADRSMTVSRCFIFSQRLSKDIQNVLVGVNSNACVCIRDNSGTIVGLTVKHLCGFLGDVFGKIPRIFDPK
jgi:hypothetical protein